LNLTDIRYPPEFKSFAFTLRSRYRIPVHIIAGALGCSTRTVWKWIVACRDGQKLSRRGWRRKYANMYGALIEPALRRVVKIKPWGKHPAHVQHTIEMVREAFRRLLRWIHFRDSGGYLDLIACAEGEEPP
jgi:hypothetical protein